MRKIGAKPILVFSLLITAAGFLCLFIVRVILGGTGVSLFGLAVASLFAFFLCSVLIYRLFLWRFPLKEGDIATGSRQEFVYHVYLLFYLVLFYQLIRPKIIPVPLLKLIYLMLGAKLGKNTFCSGTILDPIFTVAGDNTIIGEDSCLFPHAIEGNHLSHKKIILGSHVTIGAKCILMAGVEVGDYSIVAAGSVVPKNTIIGESEIWGGNPARFIKKTKEGLSI